MLRRKIRRLRSDLKRILGNSSPEDYINRRNMLLCEMAEIVKLGEFAPHRENLEAGKPCPLCGATRHPFRRGHMPTTEDIEREIAVLSQRIWQAEQIIENIKYMEQVLAMEAEKPPSKKASGKIPAKRLKTINRNFRELENEFIGIKYEISKKFPGETQSINLLLEKFDHRLRLFRMEALNGQNKKDGRAKKQR